MGGFLMVFSTRLIALFEYVCASVLGAVVWNLTAHAVGWRWIPDGILMVIAVALVVPKIIMVHVHLLLVATYSIRVVFVVIPLSGGKWGFVVLRSMVGFEATTIIVARHCANVKCRWAVYLWWDEWKRWSMG